MRDSLVCEQLDHVIQLSLAVVVILSLGTTASRGKTPDPESGSCHEPGIGVEINARVTPPTVSTDFTYAQISTLARQTLQPPRHPPYGFYLGRVWYRFALYKVLNNVEGCASGLQVVADIDLVERRIEIASDLARDTCLPQIVLDHYKRHAKADAQAFEKFTGTMQGRVVAALAAVPPAARAELSPGVRAALDVVLAELDKTRQNAQATVDSPSELNKLAHPTCSAI